MTEMLVVIAVIGLIAAVLTPNLLGQLARAKSKAADLQLKGLTAAVQLFRDDVGRYPTDAEGLSVLINEPQGTEGWTGPYVGDSKSLLDPWGQPIRYRTQPPPRGFSVTSLGADGKDGGKGADRDLEAPVLAAVGP